MTADSRRACPRCGRPIPADAPEGLCPVCLFDAAASPAEGSGRDSLSNSVGSLGGAHDPAARFAAGARLGPYEIGRLIGRGGMGEVYEATHVDDGRRVAIKALAARLDRTEDRERFRREGELTATVTHPNVVYVFGAEEYDGVPVIVMELLAAGSLRQRVRTTGPMSPVDAVEAIVQVIAGLEAARAVGVLHKDVKPSNCFVESDGVVKIGDFGLAVLLDDRDAGEPAQSFRGTPGFASPEQLRGDPLDVRSDIYGVGATLYYLLTGEPPCDERDPRKLLEAMRSGPPIEASTRDSRIPAGLSRLVQEMLAFEPADRPSSFDALADELSLYGVFAPQPASLGRRFVAGLFDAAVLFVLILAYVAIPGLIGRIVNAPEVVDGATRAVSWTSGLIALVYYGIFEGTWGRALGKQLCGLRVIDAEGRPPGFLRAALRLLISDAPSQVLVVATLIFGVATVQVWRVELRWLEAIVYFVWGAIALGVLWDFNWQVMLHDLMTRTRVVEPVTTRKLARPQLAPISLRLTPVDPLTFGPFAVSAIVARSESGEVVYAGVDARLKRPVWVHVTMPGTPPVSALRRSTRRTGRLRWLAGVRTAGTSWDAYEAPTGAPLQAVAPQPWSSVKRWLADLARELDAATDERAVPPLTLDRVWITADNHAKLIEFLPQTKDTPRTADASSSLFLAAVANRALGSETSAHQSRVPVTARRALDRLIDPNAASARAASSILEPLELETDGASFWRRSLGIAIVAAPVVLLSTAAAVSQEVTLINQRQGTDALVACLQLLRDETRPGQLNPYLRVEHDAIEIYVVGKFSPQIRESGDSILPITLRPIWAKALRDHPAVTPQAFERARGLVEPSIDAYLEPGRRTAAMTMRIGIVAAVGGVASAMLAAIGVLGIIVSIVRPGGIVLGWAGLGLVSQSGEEISRRRSLTRALVTWSPVLLILLAPYAADHAPSRLTVLLMWMPAGLMLVAGVATLLSPSRSPADRLCGTWVV